IKFRRYAPTLATTSLSDPGRRGERPPHLLCRSKVCWISLTANSMDPNSVTNGAVINRTLARIPGRISARKKFKLCRRQTYLIRISAADAMGMGPALSAFPPSMGQMAEMHEFMDGRGTPAMDGGDRAASG